MTLDDATSELYSAFFVEEEGTVSSFQGLREAIETWGLFSSLNTDWDSHYWHTDEAGGKVDKTQPTPCIAPCSNWGLRADNTLQYLDSLCQFARTAG